MWKTLVNKNHVCSSQLIRNDSCKRFKSRSSYIKEESSTDGNQKKIASKQRQRSYSKNLIQANIVTLQKLLKKNKDQVSIHDDTDQSLNQTEEGGNSIQQQCKQALIRNCKVKYSRLIKRSTLMQESANNFQLLGSFKPHQKINASTRQINLFDEQSFAQDPSQQMVQSPKFTSIEDKKTQITFIKQKLLNAVQTFKKDIQNLNHQQVSLLKKAGKSYNKTIR